MDGSHDVPIRVDHVGIAVESIEDAESVLVALGCEKLLEEAVEDRFRWAYYRLGDASRLELVEPVAAGTFLTSFLEEHGPGLHHVTLEVADLDAIVEHLAREGVRVVDRESYGGWSEAFVSPRNATGALFQLMEYQDGYEDGRRPPEALFVGGSRVEEAVER